MELPVWLNNLISYSIQMAILASTGTLLAYVFRLRMPRISLIYWQILLTVCLFLPALQNWRHPIQMRTPAISDAVFYGIPSKTAAPGTEFSFSITPEVIGLAIIAGACLRMIWLAFGYFRLRRILRHSQYLSDPPPLDKSLSSRIGVQARFFLSNEVDTPATFGLITPTVILPGKFLEMSEACRESIICHELLHVRRRDWAVILVEEIIRSIYWFHPAVWWLLSRIHLAREQSVDSEVVQLTGNRQPYLDSLLEIAQSRGRPRAVPAPLFLKERHLVQRVALLLKEASMNRLRLCVSAVGIAVLLTGTVRLAAGWFPLVGGPAVLQEDAADTANNASQRAPVGIVGKVEESKLIRKVDPIYPEQAKARGLSGRVVLAINVDEEGFVSDAEVISGHPLLREAAVTAVKQWQYSPTLLNGKAIPVMATVTVVFVLKGDEAVNGSGPNAPELPLSFEEYGGITEGAAGKTGGETPVDAEGKAVKRVPVRVGAGVMESKLIRKVDPVYSELAKRARVEGKVILSVTVDEKGSVSGIQVVSGHPFLNDAAVEAVKQWRYSPTLLNGEAVPVMATVTVVFALK
jgi:TonB family protein